MSKAQNDDSNYYFDVKTFFENVKFLEVGFFMLNFSTERKLVKCHYSAVVMAFHRSPVFNHSCCLIISD